MSQPSRVRTNVVANLAGSAWLALLGLLFPPLFARWMGVESYGLVGFYASLAALLSLFDLGLGMTLGREMARLSSGPDAEARREARDLLRTFELVYGAMGLALAAGVVALAPAFARHALNRSSALAEADVVRSIRWMGVALGAQFAQSAYVGTMTGLQRQVRLNALLVLNGTVKHGGTFAVLYAFRRDAPTYFVCQALATLSALAVLRAAAGRALGRGEGRPAFRGELLRRNAAYATGIWSGYLASIALTQTDKFAVGKLLPLADFGYYALALAAGNAIYFLNTPLFSAVVPRFTQLAEAGDRAGLTALFRKASQAMVALVVPAAAALVCLRHEVLLVWSRSEATAQIIATTFALRAAATAVHSLLYVPYGLALATGAVRVTVWVNAVGALCFVPLELALISGRGIEGAASGWLALVAATLVAWHAIVRRRGWLDEGFWAGLLRNVAAPALASLAAAALALRALPAARGALAALVAPVAALLTAVASLFVADPSAFAAKAASLLAALAALAFIAAPAALGALLAARDLGPALAATLLRALARRRRPAAPSP
ncbi:MAG TPA: lipopolysaccharide biosynthesis protein [Polyangiaceae bacterium]|nr:lipopolysaccharide biosynthesis protein [Polyangiaceae bacterium]